MAPLPAPSPRASFTLIELLVVIAIVAILSAVVIITLNPAELLKQSRDSNRLSDLNTLNKALALYEVDVVGGTLGATSTVYVSLPDTSATCANLGLPTLPVGYQYGCVTEANLRKTDGSGWIPVDLTQISSNTPLGSLPTDPVNATSSGLYYTYVPGGSYELTALMESVKRKTEQARDGGPDPGMYEIGSDLSLSPFVHGLVGYWSFDEGSGTSAEDQSGRGNDGALSGPTWTSSCPIRGCLSFDGTNDKVTVANSDSLDFGTGPVSVTFWFKTSANAEGFIVDTTQNLLTYTGFFVDYRGDSVNKDLDNRFCASTCNSRNGTTAMNGNVWRFVAVSRDGTNIRVFVNGVEESTGTDDRKNLTNNYDLVIGSSGSSIWLNGMLDDFRIYSRALSASEISAIYNATK